MRLLLLLATLVVLATLAHAQEAHESQETQSTPHDHAAVGEATTHAADGHADPAPARRRRRLKATRPRAAAHGVAREVNGVSPRGAAGAGAGAAADGEGPLLSHSEQVRAALRRIGRELAAQRAAGAVGEGDGADAVSFLQQVPPGIEQGAAFDLPKNCEPFLVVDLAPDLQSYFIQWFYPRFDQVLLQSLIPSLDSKLNELMNIVFPPRITHTINLQYYRFARIIDDELERTLGKSLTNTLTMNVGNPVFTQLTSFLTHTLTASMTATLSRTLFPLVTEKMAHYDQGKYYRCFVKFYVCTTINDAKDCSIPDDCEMEEMPVTSFSPALNRQVVA